jgi:hypothetical protein
MALDTSSMMINELMKRGEEVPTPIKRRCPKYRVIHLPALATA